jgi:hypothetical protein
MRLPWVVCLCLALTPAFAEDAALAQLDACQARLDARDVGLERIEKRCPGLLPALQNAPWGNLLPKDMRARRDEVSAQGLRELAAMIREANAALAKEAGEEAATRAAPDLARLAPVLAELGEQGEQGVTRWQRFKRWLQDKVERRKQDKDEAESWLDRLGRQFETSEGVARVVTYTGYTLVGLLVLFVIWSELRAAGLFGGSARSARRAAEGEWRRRLQLSDILAAPLADRPGLLLRLLGDALTRAHRLPSAAGLTAGEIVRRATLDSENDREQLAQVAVTAEAVRYAPRQPGPERLEGAVATARALLERLTRAGKPARKQP